jgi:hypothetical protein
MTTSRQTSGPHSLIEFPAWQALLTHHQQIRDIRLRQLFAEDPERGRRLTLEAAGLYLDYSKNRITAETLRLLVNLTSECRLQQRIEAMFHGEKINATEKRAVLHVALRAPRGASIVVDRENVVPLVHEVLDRMTAFAEKIRLGHWKGHTGKPIRNIVNIGIGGSDLGPVMAFEALRHYSQRDLSFRFVSNVDGTDFAEAVDGLSADETLFIVVEDLHDARNHDQRAKRSCLATPVSGGRTSHRPALCSRFDQCSRGVQVRNRYGQYVRVLGLGRRTLFHGLGHWAVDTARHWFGELSLHAGRI